MSAYGRHSAFIFCILTLIAPVLYAQNEAIPLTIVTLPEKGQLISPIIIKIAPILEKEFLEAVVKPLDQKSIDKKTEENIASVKFSFPIYLIPTRQSIFFAQSYKKADEMFLDFIDRKNLIDVSGKNNEKKILREQWQNFFGIDIWYPYFKAKEIENWIGDKTKVEIFHFKGRMKFENNQIKYTFRTQF